MGVRSENLKGATRSDVNEGQVKSSQGQVSQVSVGQVKPHDSGCLYGIQVVAAAVLVAVEAGPGRPIRAHVIVAARVIAVEAGLGEPIRG